MLTPDVLTCGLSNGSACASDANWYFPWRMIGVEMIMSSLIVTARDVFQR